MVFISRKQLKVEIEDSEILREIASDYVESVIPLRNLNCHQMLVYFLDPDQFFRRATSDDLTCLAYQLYNYGHITSLIAILPHLRDCTVPGVMICHIDEYRNVLRYINNGVKFHGSRDVDLSDYNVDVYNANDLLELSRYFTVRQVSLHCAIAEHDLTDAIKSHMRRVNVCSKTIDDSSLIHFTKLHTLDIRVSCDVKLRFLKSDHPLCDSLRELRIPPFAEIHDNKIECLTNLKRLYVKDNTDIKLAFLSASHPLTKSLVELDASWASGISDEALQFLRLEKLIASNNKNITLNFLTESDHPLSASLKHLEIVGMSRVTDEVLDTLTHLQHLNAASNNLVTLSFVTKGHPLAKTLRELIAIDTCTIGDRGIKYLSVEKLNVRDNTRVSLKFVNNTFADYPLVESLRELDASESCKVTDREIEQFTLRVLDVEENEEVSLNFLRHGYHPMCKTLKELNISSNSSVRDLALSHLALNKLFTAGNKNIKMSFLTKKHPMTRTLRVLDAYGWCGISDAKLEMLRNLRELDCGANEKISLEFLQDFKHPMNKTLTKLIAKDDSNVSDMSIVNTHLTVLNANNNDQISLRFLVDGYHPLQDTLKELFAGHSCNISDKNIEKLTLRRLKSVNNNKISYVVNW